MPTRTSSAFLCFAIPCSAFASDFTSLKFESFVDDAGASVGIGGLVNESPSPQSRSTPNRSGFAVFFWADWCVPCKEELSLVLANRALLSGIELIAVNVDEPSEWAKARQTLLTKGWSGTNLWSWRDPGGSYFYRARPSGDLPQTVLLGRNGDALKSFTALDAASLATFRSSLEEASGVLAESLLPTRGEGASGADGEDAPTRAARFGLGMNGWFRENRLPPTPGAGKRYSSLWAQSLFVTAEAPFVSPGIHVRAKVTHDLVGQKLSTRKETWEDELGESSMSVVAGEKDAAGGQDRFTVGDETVTLVEGLVLQVRQFAPANEARRIRGVHYRHEAKRWALFANHGLVENRLFDYTLDTSTDVTQRRDPVVVTAVGGDLQLSESVRLGVAAATSQTFERVSRGARQDPVDTEGFRHFGKVNVEAGAPRFGGNVEHRSQHVQFSAGAAGYPGNGDARTGPAPGHAVFSSFGLGLLERNQGTDADVPTLVSNDVIAGLFLNGNYTRSVLQPVLSSTPDLNVDFATPVVASRRQAYRVQPTLALAPFENEKQLLDVSPLFVREEGVSSDRGEAANTWGVEQGVSAWGQKLLATRRDFRSRTLSEKGREHVANGTTNLLTPYLTSQVTYRSIRLEEVGTATGSRSRRGNRVAANLGVQSGSLLEEWGKLSFSVTRTHQSGEYVGLSGIDGKKLTSFRAGWTHSLVQLSAAYGREPGGVVCTAGSCRQVPPLNGLAIDLSGFAAF